MDRYKVLKIFVGIQGPRNLLTIVQPPVQNLLKYKEIENKLSTIKRCFVIDKHTNAIASSNCLRFSL